MIGKYLDISTAHITYEEMLALKENKDDHLPVIATYPEGFFLYVSDSIGELEGAPNVTKILWHAMDQQAYIVRLDADGAIIEHLPTFEWDPSGDDQFLDEIENKMEQVKNETELRSHAALSQVFHELKRRKIDSPRARGLMTTALHKAFDQMSHEQAASLTAKVYEEADNG